MRKIIFAFIAMSWASVSGQSAKGFVSLTLQDLSDFRPQDGNWRIAGDVVIDRNVDIHDKVLVNSPTPSKKTKKGQAAPAPVYIAAQPVTFKEGSGILLNMNDEKRRSHLITNF